MERAKGKTKAAGERINANAKQLKAKREYICARVFL